MKLTTKTRNALPASSFAEPSKRKYPVNDKNHARNALARVSAFGSSAEKVAVKAKVKAKFPAIGKKKEGSGKEEAGESNKERKAEGDNFRYTSEGKMRM